MGQVGNCWQPAADWQSACRQWSRGIDLRISVCTVCGLPLCEAGCQPNKRYPNPSSRKSCAKLPRTPFNRPVCEVKRGVGINLSFVRVADDTLAICAHSTYSVRLSHKAREPASGDVMTTYVELSFFAPLRKLSCALRRRTTVAVACPSIAGRERSAVLCGLESVENFTDLTGCSADHAGSARIPRFLAVSGLSI